MSTRAIAKTDHYGWTCDRCGKDVEFLSGHSPKDWRSVSRSGGPGNHWLLCADCLSEFPEWFRAFVTKAPDV